MFPSPAPNAGSFHMPSDSGLKTEGHDTLHTMMFSLDIIRESYVSTRCV